MENSELSTKNGHLPFCTRVEKIASVLAVLSAESKGFDEYDLRSDEGYEYKTDPRGKSCAIDHGRVNGEINAFG